MVGIDGRVRTVAGRLRSEPGDEGSGDQTSECGHEGEDEQVALASHEIEEGLLPSRLRGSPSRELLEEEVDPRAGEKVEEECAAASDDADDCAVEQPASAVPDLGVSKRGHDAAHGLLAALGAWNGPDAHEGRDRSRLIR